jgi:hypothetical protein
MVSAEGESRIMMGNRPLRRVILTSALFGVVAFVALSGVGAATAGVGKPSRLAAHNITGAPAVPYLAWSPVAGADRYEVQVAADASFKAPVLAAANLTTANTRATLTKTLPSHTYWWRVRAASKSGAVSAWATASFSIVWRARVVRLSPTEMRWLPVRGAAKYSVELSSDPQFAAASLVGGRPILTASNSISPPAALPKNTYYWRVTPLDAEGNPSLSPQPQPPWEFPWNGPGSSVLNAPADNFCVWRKPAPDSDQCAPGPTPGNPVDFPGSPDTVFVPELSWKPVAGASRYEVQINPDKSWAAGSSVCCDGTTAALRLTPTISLLSNKYYWRVRGLDGAGNAGPWFPSGDGTDADAFTKTFDNACRADLPENCLQPPIPSIADLHLEDSMGRLQVGATTNSPVIRWNAVPGASSYEYEVATYSAGCRWGSDISHGVTAVTAWTPLGNPSAPKPYPDSTPVASGGRLDANAQYCVRVRAQTDRDPHGRPVYGDFTYLPNPDQPAFRFGAYPVGGGSALARVSSVGPVDGGPGLREMPVFTWAPLAGAASYWVIVARDASFTNIVDYAFTQIPAYAPRRAAQPTTYADETTSYYWVVLPSPLASGACIGSACDPLQLQPFKFQKEVPPTSLRVERSVPQPTFSWNPVPGARHYELQVSQDPNFGSSFVERVTTVATSYTARLTYPPGKKLFWRVRADDEKLIGLTWADGAPDGFQVELLAPKQPRTDTSGAGGITTLHWQPVEGAVSYDVHVQLPNASTRDFSNLRVTQLTLSALTGTGAFRWQVRARYARGSGGGTIIGPYSEPRSSTQTVWQPASMRTLVSRRGLLLTWSPVLYARSYRVEVSMRRDFGNLVESTTTDNPSWAPKLQGALGKGGRFYWRVAAMDSSSNTGRFTTPRSFAFSPGGH